MNHAGCSPFPRIWGAMASPPSDTVCRRPVPSPGSSARFGRTRGPALSITRSPSAIRCTRPASLARARHVTEWMLSTAAGRGPVCGRENPRPCCDRTRWPSSPPDAVPYVHATSAEVNDDEHARIFRGSVARRSTHRLSRDGGRETHGRRARDAAVLLLRVPAAADLLANRRRLALLLCAVLHSPRILSAWLLPKRLLTPKIGVLRITGSAPMSNDALGQKLAFARTLVLVLSLLALPTSSDAAFENDLAVYQATFTNLDPNTGSSSG